jgi:hypothetical protein
MQPFVSKEHAASICIFEEYTKQTERGLLFHPEDGGYTFL